MSISSIDWSFLDFFFGDYGKLFAALGAILVAALSLLVAIYKYLHAGKLDRILGRGAAEVEKQRRFYRQGKAALEQAEKVLKEQEEKIRQREQRLHDVRNAFIGKEHDLWCMHRARKPVGYDAQMLAQRKRPVILVANLKGGVGKSTLTANLAAYFTTNNKRVLLIDGDYQGSLSNMLLSADGVEKASAEVNKLLMPGSDTDSFRGAVRPFNKVIKGSSLIAAKYELAAIENRLMIEHILQEEGDDDDGRYRFAKLLLNAEIADTFDVALIDAPPRLTAATINGFCASTHLLIPTVYDMMSAEAIGTFLHGVLTLKTSLNHSIDLLGIVGMLTSQQYKLSEREQNAKAAAMRQVAQVWGANFHFFDRHIPRKEAIAKAAGSDIAYYCDEDVCRWFNELGGAMRDRLWPEQFQTKSRQIRSVPQLSQDAMSL